MATEWKKYKLGELCDLIGGYAFKSQDFGNYSDKVIKITNINPPIVDASNLVGVNLSKYDYKKLEKYKVTQGDYVLAMTGATIGKLGKIVDAVDYYVNQRVLIFKPISELVDKNYLFYCLLKNDFKNFILNYVDSETAQANISATTVGLYSCTIPNLQTQQKIAKILSSLDEKIELNNKINENLHAQAQAIFKSWFVDFEPFGGTMPSDWKEKSLVQLADFVNGLAMQRFRPKENEKALPVLKIRELRLGDCDSSSELCSSTVKQEYIVNQGDIIFSWSGSLLVNVWSGKQCGLNQHLFNVKPKEFYSKWFVFMWVQYHLDNFIAIANDKATTMGHIKREHLEKAKVFVPAQKAYQQLGKLLNPIFEYSLNLRIKNKKLAQIRDILLPKLMSGELEV